MARVNNDLSVPVNLALAQDGSLVYVLPDRVCCKDLFDAEPKLRFERPVMRGNVATTFAGFSEPDQLLVRDGRIIAVSDGGAFVRVYALSDGHPLGHGNDDGLPWNTSVTPATWNVHLRLAGNRLYITGPQELTNYGLGADPTDYWPKPIQNTDGPHQTSVVIQDIVITPENTLLVLVPPQNLGNGNQGVLQLNGLAGINAAPPVPEAKPTTVRIRPFSRQIVPSGHESGICTNFDRVITDPAGIADLQIVDGGIYYLTGDHRVHFLRGTP